MSKNKKLLKIFCSLIELVEQKNLAKKIEDFQAKDNYSSVLCKSFAQVMWD